MIERLNSQKPIGFFMLLLLVAVGLKKRQRKVNISWVDPAQRDDSLENALTLKILADRKKEAKKQGDREAVSIYDLAIKIQYSRLFDNISNLGSISSKYIQSSNNNAIYGVESTFLAGCWRWLNQKSQFTFDLRNQHNQVVIGPGPEWACIVTGIQVDGVRMLSNMLPVRFAQQSVAIVRFDLDDFHRALRGIQRWGFNLHAVFHSHRNRGFVSPSHIDMDTQRNLLEPVYPAIQAVFSEDGYIRFFSFDRPYTIRVFGKGVEHVEDTLIKLNEDLCTATLGKSVWSPMVSTI